MAGSEATASEVKPLDVQTIGYPSLPSDSESGADFGGVEQVESDAAEHADEVREVHAAASEATPLLLRQHLLCRAKQQRERQSRCWRRRRGRGCRAHRRAQQQRERQRERQRQI